MYTALLERLFALARHRSGRQDLTVMKELCRFLGEPQRAFSSVHIAGTNGKGSVATMTAAGLAVRHKKVGLYTSPHIATFRERIRLNGIPLAIEAVEELLPEIFAIVDREELPASFFEVTTALAFAFFKRQQVEIAVIETGLGGRLDATNVIIPLLSVITSISYDHTELLGHTMEEIAVEKGGIIKEQVPLVIGPTVPLRPIEALTKEKGAPLHEVKVFCSDYRAENRAIADKALRLLNLEESAIQKALQVLPPCRFERYTSPQGVPVIFDVAHNAAGLQRLAALIQEHFGLQQCHTVMALSATKDLPICLEMIAACVQQWYPIAADNGRSYAVTALTAALLQRGIPQGQISIHDGIAAAMRSAHDAATASGSPLLVCGSFFIMTAARQALGIHDDKDPYDLNERAVFVRYGS